MSESTSAHDVVAFSVAQGWTSIPYDRFIELSPIDPLYKSLVNAHKEKERRADARTALLCSIMANCMSSGGKRYEIKDFMPQDKTLQDSNEEMNVKANLMRYAASKNS
jgi:hypothetical protein